MKSKATIFVLVCGFFATIWILWLGLVHKHNDPLNLLHALGSGNVEEVRQLLQLDPKLVNQNTLFNIPPLFEAVEEGKDQIAELLVENHADINARAHSRWGKTALHMAAQKSDTKMVEFLLEHKADVNARDDRLALAGLNWPVRHQGLGSAKSTFSIPGVTSSRLGGGFFTLPS